MADDLIHDSRNTGFQCPEMGFVSGMPVAAHLGKIGGWGNGKPWCSKPGEPHPAIEQRVTWRLLHNDSQIEKS